MRVDEIGKTNARIVPTFNTPNGVGLWGYFNQTH